MSPTPPPDDPRSRGDDPDPPPAPRAGRRSSSASDEIRAFLASSLQGRRPLSSASGSGTALWELADVVDHPVDESGPTRPGSVSVEPGTVAGATAARVEWAPLMLRSYASAVTLALGWLLWSGRALPPPPPPSVAREAPPVRPRPAEPVRATVAAKSTRVPTTTLGKPLAVGDLEVTPLMVLRRSVRVARNLGDHMLYHEHYGCLAMTIRVRNAAAQGASLRPIVAADLIDGDGFAIEAPPGPGIAMFSLAPGGEWAVEDQEFPEVAPGGVVDLVLLSEPLAGRRLASTMTWRFRVAIDPSRATRVDLAVTFSPVDIP